MRLAAAATATLGKHWRLVAPVGARLAHTCLRLVPMLEDFGASQAAPIIQDRPRQHPDLQRARESNKCRQGGASAGQGGWAARG
jgi:hypothetical protein